MWPDNSHRKQRRQVDSQKVDRDVIQIFMARERVAGVDQRLKPEEGSGGPGGRTREPFANHKKPIPASRKPVALSRKKRSLMAPLATTPGRIEYQVPGAIIMRTPFAVKRRPESQASLSSIAFSTVTDETKQQSDM